jgi:2-polyprenyl-6-methoxyphenol hydroxylase-like FAD-dependent oxidoreductase
VANHRALIIGGSLAGLFAAHLLRSIGWDVDVFERNRGNLSDRGAGIGTHQALVEIGRRIGLNIEQTMGVETRAYVCVDRNGHVLHEIPLRRVMSAWGVIYRALKDALPSHCYHDGSALTQVTTRADRVNAAFADGSQATGDLLIGADGFRSTVREQFLPQLQPHYAGYVAWRALISEQLIPPSMAVFDRMTFCIPDSELAVSYPVPAHDGDIRIGHRAYNVVWYRPANAGALADLCTDINGCRHEISLPPTLIRSELVAAMKAESHTLLGRPIAEILARASHPFFHPIFDIAAPELVFGRVVLLGDAAFVARPHVGAGITKAALDAACLADAIAAYPLEEALARYNIERQRFGNWIVARGRAMGACIGNRPEILSDDPEREFRIMREYATMAHDIRELSVDGSAPPHG